MTLDAALTAAHSGHTDAVLRYLAEGGALEAANRDGFTLLLVALEGRQWKLARTLLEQGASPNAALGTGHRTLHVLTKHFRNRPVGLPGADAEHAEMLQLAALLLEKGFEVGTTFGAKKTPTLRYAAECSPALARLILDRAQADVNAADLEGFTALHHAARRGDVPLIEALLARGATLDAADALGFTPLHEALLSNHGAAVAALVKHGASLTATLTGSDGPHRAGDDARAIAKTLGRSALLSA